MNTLLFENNNSALADIIRDIDYTVMDNEFRAFHTKQGYADKPCICKVETEALKTVYFTMLYLGSTLEEYPNCTKWGKLDWSNLESVFGFTINDKIEE